MNIARNAAKERSQGEEADGGSEHPPGSEAVCHPATDGYEHCQAEGVAGQNGLHAQGSDAQSRRDGRHGGVEDGGVERLHEKRHRDQPGQQVLAGSGWLRGGDWGVAGGHMRVALSSLY